MKQTVIGIGEALFDCLPDRNILGGAPLNFAVHAHQLLAPSGGQGVVVSCVGQDTLGDAVIEQLGRLQLSTAFVQRCAQRRTGQVTVELDTLGQPSYTIQSDVAWDHLALTPALENLLGNCQGICFGTLAQRCPETCRTIQTSLQLATHAIRLFDVNLRQQFFDAALISASLEAATVAKLNEEELRTVCDLLDLTGNAGQDVDQLATMLRTTYQLDLVAVTRGVRGTVLYVADARLEASPVTYAAAPDADSVGAGDACCAGLMLGLLKNWPLTKTLELANHAGAYVASQPGGTPVLPAEILALAYE